MTKLIFKFMTMWEFTWKRNIYFGGEAVIKQPRFLSVNTIRFSLGGFVPRRRLSLKETYMF